MDKNFLEKVVMLFIENGAKTLTMDDIAKEFGMSKKTLYQHYKNKEALLEDVLAFKLNDVIEQLNMLDDTVENAVERMFCRDQQIEEAVKSNKSLFIRQLVRYYPAIFNKHISEFSDRFTDVLLRNIKKGREQGYYRTDFNETAYAQLFFSLIMSYDNSPFIDNEIFDRNQFHEEVVLFYMNAITTEEGKKYIKQYNKLNK
ncbi:TetR/AcrR family transcriptional regulator [Chryseobacterium lacus]|uniref:TetR/AcrR family transcriptional regulator n=1 Tax=Chryseobacterium lacus TaxID=2058346 RepID=A0A368MYL8_9FLAO|nr:TetR/AcrR family transcriptional regulator [Chryseobacterium lacus]RCU42484.1 TetR/AcrR family transcriptional regulator [Chryseobacterium lacus]RST27045.1 TetR/AcrR family transcriptional regulator [Chryseobacterium lacus]